MYRRLIDSGARGRYLPDLVVHHHVHPDSAAQGLLPLVVFLERRFEGRAGPRRAAAAPPLIAGVPRYVYGDALRGLVTWLRASLPRGPASQRTAGELPSWHLAGRLYGRYFLRDEPRRARRAPAATPHHRAVRR